LPRFDYTARDKSGKKVIGELTAADESDLTEKLSHSGMILISAQAVKFEIIKKDVHLKSDKVLSFTNNLSSLIKGGLRLLEALNVLGQDTKDEDLASLILSLRDYIEAGGHFKGALQLYPKTFSPLYISMVDAGEKTGKLGLVLEQIADYLEWQLDLRLRIKELATYPAIIFAVMVLVVSVLMGWVLPKFEPILKELGTDLPLPTKIVLGVSHFFTSYWYLLFGGVIGLFFAVKFALKNKVVQLHYDTIKLKLPILGKLINNICLVRFCRAMSLGLSSGINIVENLELAKEVVGNMVLANAIVSIKESVINGGHLSVGFAVTKAFPPFLVRMVEVGERSGNLVEGFSKVYDYYNKEIPRVIKQIFTLLEPLLIVVMGVVVGGITLSVFLPLVKMSQALGG